MFNTKTTVYEYEMLIVILDTHMTVFWTDPLANSRSNHRVCVWFILLYSGGDIKFQPPPSVTNFVLS